MGGIGTIEVILIDNTGRKAHYQTETAKTASQIVDELEEREKIRSEQDALVGV